jgi:hypothetical protein
VDNSAHIQVSQDFRGSGLCLNVEAGVLDGQNVETNERAQLDTGFYLGLVDREGHKVTSGFNLTYFGYKENQRFFSLGNGGYFSPERFMAATVPFSYSYGNERFETRLEGAVGVQYYTEQGAAFFPGSQELQLQLEQEVQRLLEDDENAGFAAGLATGYPGLSETDISLRGSASFTYKVAPNASLTGGLSFDRVANFNEAVGFVGVKFWPNLE